jgi:hypothetical protein
MMENGGCLASGGPLPGPGGHPQHPRPGDAEGDGQLPRTQREQTAC